MKKTNFLLMGLAFAAFTLASCSKENDVTPSNDPAVQSATIDAGTDALASDDAMLRCNCQTPANLILSTYDQTMVAINVTNIIVGGSVQHSVIGAQTGFRFRTKLHSAGASCWSSPTTVYTYTFTGAYSDTSFFAPSYQVVLGSSGMDVKYETILKLAGCNNVVLGPMKIVHN